MAIEKATVVCDVCGNTENAEVNAARQRDWSYERYRYVSLPSNWIERVEFDNNLQPMNWKDVCPRCQESN